MSNVCIQLVPYYHSYSKVSERPYCLNYTNSSGELASTRFTYTGKGRNDKAFYQQITGSRSSRNFHSFDKEGRMVKKVREYNDGETSTEVFSYNPEGRLLRESFESSNGTKGTAEYVYDEKGHASRMICKGYKGWFHGELVFEMDDHGKRLAGIIKQEDGTEGTIDYKYDQKGSLIFEQWDIGGKWSQTLQYVYEEIG